MESARVLKWAVSSRLCLFALQVLCHNLVPDHQASMDDVFMSGGGRRDPPHGAPVEALLGGLDNWDAEYFVFVAEHGYARHEQTMAFFPLLPALMRVLAETILRPLTSVLSLREVLLLAGVVVNFAAFPLAALLLYRLTLRLFGAVRDDDRRGRRRGRGEGRKGGGREGRLALLSSLLFCLNPASVFMSAVYTETLFVTFSFLGMWLLEEEREEDASLCRRSHNASSSCISSHRSWLAAVAFGLATATRSNGIVLCGYLGYYHLKPLVWDLLSWLKLCSSSPLPVSIKLRLPMRSLRSSLLTFCAQCLVSASPFVLFQWYGYYLYCQSDNIQSQSSESVALLTPEGAGGTHPVPVWCDWRVPLPYSHIQSHYWDVGLLRYYRLKQVPNFLLAAPAVALGAYCLWRSRDLSRGHVTSKGTGGDSVVDFRVRLLPYSLHLVFLLLVGVLTMHIQVVTRFIFSSSPLLYWFSAEPILHTISPSPSSSSSSSSSPPPPSPPSPSTHTSSPVVPSLSFAKHDRLWGAFYEVCRGVFSSSAAPIPLPSPGPPTWDSHIAPLALVVSRCVLVYFISYVVLGFLLHCNFLPWT